MTYDDASDARYATASAISDALRDAAHRRELALAGAAPPRAARRAAARSSSHRRLDRARQHRVAADAVRAVVDGDAARQRDHGGLRGAVDVVAREGLDALDRRHVDDRARTRRQHPPHRDRRAVHRPQLQHAQAALDLARVDLVRAALDVDAGVVDPDREAPALLRDVGGELVRRPVADVAPQPARSSRRERRRCPPAPPRSSRRRPRRGRRPAGARRSPGRRPSPRR